MLSTIPCSYLQAQISADTGNIVTAISQIITNIPGSGSDDYRAPNHMEINKWNAIIDNVLAQQYHTANDSAQTIGYRLRYFWDTIDTDKAYYILEAIDTNYWGTYVYYPDYCRNLVIQATHPQKDLNTGQQGIFVFQQTKAAFFMLSGTNRCNSTMQSTCTGTTSSCSSNSAPYRISDLAHTTTSPFQYTLRRLMNWHNNLYYIQLHGFSKKSTDPYVVLSNGSRIPPAVDYLLALSANLYAEDTVLTFKIAHIDLNWTRLIGFWNTQGRAINNSISPCDSNATTSMGYFLHIEQERTRLRNSQTEWTKMANALSATFNCNQVMPNNAPLSLKSLITIYPNPTRQHITVTFTTPTIDTGVRMVIYNRIGQALQQELITEQQATYNVSSLPFGLYFLVFYNLDGSLIYKEKLSIK